MALLAEWNGHKFEVTPFAVRGFGDLQISGSCKTSDTSKTFNINVPNLNKKTGERQYDKKGNLKTKKEKHTNKFKKFSSGEPIDLSFSAYLHTQLGCDVRNEAMDFINDAERGAKGYLYIDGHKIVTCEMMLTKASVSEVKIAPNGWWLSATVNLSMVQASTFDQSTDFAAAFIPARLAESSTLRLIRKISTSTNAVNGWTETREQIAALGLDDTETVIYTARQASQWS